MRFQWLRGGPSLRGHPSEESLSVVVVAGTRVHRDALVRSLDGRDGIRVVGSVASAEDLTPWAGESPAIVLVDAAASADRRSAIAQIVETLPEAKVVVLSLPETDTDVIPFAEAGVAGFIPQNSSVQEVVACLRSAASDDLICSPRVAGILLRRVRAAARAGADGHASAALTQRQLQILELIGEGLSNRAIAARLCIEVSTVKNHVHQILDRLQVRRRSEAAARLRAWNGSLMAVVLLATSALDSVATFGALFS